MFMAVFCFSEHKNWRYQDLYYVMGLLKFRHRLLKTFQIVIYCNIDDPEFERHHYLPFERFRIIEDDLGKWCTVDKVMHKELMRRMPTALVAMYGSSAQLGRFLTNLDKLCRDIFRGFAC